MRLTYFYIRLLGSLFHWWMGLSVKQTAFWLGGAFLFLSIAAIIHFLG